MDAVAIALLLVIPIVAAILLRRSLARQELSPGRRWITNPARRAELSARHPRAFSALAGVFVAAPLAVLVALDGDSRLDVSVRVLVCLCVGAVVFIFAVAYPNRPSSSL